MVGTVQRAALDEFGRRMHGTVQRTGLEGLGQRIHVADSKS